MYTLYIKEIVEDEHGNNPIILSRTAPELVYELFKKEVPEIAGDTVFIKGVVREPGERTKIAVYSKQAGVDPVGACVGQKGIRVKAVNDDLGLDEKIDIIQYNEDDALFIREALSPAKVKDVEVDKKTKVAKVTVDEEQAPLAIGKHGINVNLASKLTGYQLDIIQEQSDQAAVSHKEEISQDAPQATEPVLSEGEDTAPVTEEATATPSEETPSVTEEVSEEAA
ncbi:MAG: hypothetical protein UZ21_OP11001000528 [Microgenomates bacterium OLB22]|nr:MAG: hypothetical protein UZ21_OP11001000528 [Microgenomates bacterium OLB22]